MKNKNNIIFFIFSIALFNSFFTAESIIKKKSFSRSVKKQLLLKAMMTKKEPSIAQNFLYIPKIILKQSALITTSLILGVGTTAIINEQNIDTMAKQANICNELYQWTGINLSEQFIKHNSGKAIQIGAELIVLSIAYYIILILLFDYILKSKDTADIDLHKLAAALEELDD